MSSVQETYDAGFNCLMGFFGSYNIPLMDEAYDLGLPVIVTWHPAYLLRQQGESYQERLKEAIADFSLARDRLR